MYSLSQTLTCIELPIFIELNGVDTHMISQCFGFFLSFLLDMKNGYQSNPFLTSN